MNPVRSILVVNLALAAQAGILDRIAVTVDQHVIAESEVIRDLRVAAFLDQKPVDSSGAAKRMAATRLVDQYLILEDAAAARVTMPAEAEAAGLLANAKAQYPSDAEFRAALSRYQITEPDLAGHLLAGLRTLRYTEIRFGPEVEVSEDDLRAYYATLAEGWKKEKPEQVPSFEASRDQVESLLTNQRMMQALDRWLGLRKGEAKVLYRDEVFQ